MPALPYYGTVAAGVRFHLQLDLQRISTNVFGNQEFSSALETKISWKCIPLLSMDYLNAS